MKALAITFSVFLSLTLIFSACGSDDKSSDNAESTAVQQIDLSDDPIKVVTNLDPERYLGKWYEIATIPQWFQEYCVGGVTAEYSIRDDGDIKVLNRCFSDEGVWEEREGLAWIEDPALPSKLKVSFLKSRDDPFAADYWVIDLGEDYEYAVVGHPLLEYGWILSRTPELEQEVLDGIVERLEAQGYDYDKFEETNQADYQ